MLGETLLWSSAGFGVGPLPIQPLPSIWQHSPWFQRARFQAAIFRREVMEILCEAVSPSAWAVLA